MAKNNAINNESASLTLDPGASGDPFVQFDINGTGEFRIGVDDNDSDKFKIASGSALGTNDCFVMTAAGENTMPLQPAFFAHINANQNNLTGNGTVAKVNFTSERFDQNGDYDGTNTFTAPVTGKYKFSYNVNPSGLDATSTYGQMQIVTTARTYNGPTLNLAQYRETTTDTAGINMAISSVDMTAADTAYCTLTVNGMGADTVDLTTTHNATHFAGSLDV